MLNSTLIARATSDEVSRGPGEQNPDLDGKCHVRSREVGILMARATADHHRPKKVHLMARVTAG